MSRLKLSKPQQPTRTRQQPYGHCIRYDANECMSLLPCVLALQALLSFAAKQSLHLHNVLLEQAVELQPPRLSQTPEHIIFAAHAKCHEAGWMGNT